MKKSIGITNDHTKLWIGRIAIVMGFILIILSVLKGTFGDPEYETIKYFEQGNPVYKISVDAGTEWDKLGLPSSLRAVVSFKTDKPTDETNDDEVLEEHTLDCYLEFICNMVDVDHNHSGDCFDYSQMVFVNSHINGSSGMNPENPENWTLSVNKEAAGEYSSSGSYYVYRFTVNAPDYMYDPADPSATAPVYKAYIVEQGEYSGTYILVSAADMADAAKNNVTVIELANNYPYIEFESGKEITFNLKHGQSLVFIDTPSDATYDTPMLILNCKADEKNYPAVDEPVLICNEEDGHIHSNDCYSEPELGCGEEEYRHTHDDGCYIELEQLDSYEDEDGELVEEWSTISVLDCNEDDGHIHSNDCYNEPELVCDDVEYIHTHDDNCYSTHEPNEGEELSEGTEQNHHHTSECYGIPALLCTEEAQFHIHTPEHCYILHEEPICGIIAHEHNEDEDTTLEEEFAIDSGFQQTIPSVGTDGEYVYIQYGYIAPEDEVQLRESGQLVIYTIYYEDGSEAYRIHGTYDGENEGWFACDENGNITGIVQEIPVTWQGNYDGNTPGTYILTAQIENFNYDGIMPIAVIIVKPVAATGSISGFLSVDNGNDLINDEDEIFASGEQPLMDCAVYLYSKNDLTNAIAATQTDLDGGYIFGELEPGTYVLGIGSFVADGIEYPLAAVMTVDGNFMIDWYSDPLMAYTETIVLDAGQAVEQINAVINLYAPVIDGPLRAPTPGTSYIIDVNDYLGSVLATGKGYSYNVSTQIITFNSGANGNDYTIIRTQGGSGSVKGVVFESDVSPASVTFENLIAFTGGITLPAGFNADLTFNNVELTAINDPTSGAALTLPAGYNGTLAINGLSVTSLTLPPDYYVPITYNGLSAHNGINYPAGYNEHITIGGSFNVNKDKQFPAGYTGSVTIGDTGGTFSIANTICRPGTDIGIDKGIYLPNAISTLTINNAKTSGSGHLNILLGDTDEFELLLAGSSNIHGYIRVPTNATLAIDSKNNPGIGSENGSLSITSNDDLNAVIGGYKSVHSGQITINGGTLNVTKNGGDGAGIGGGSQSDGYVTINGGNVTVISSSGNGAVIGSGSGYARVGHVTINGGKVTAIGNNANRIGAAIGGGNEASAEVLITGGIVVADISKTASGADNGSSAAAIGGGTANNGFHGSGVGNVTITGGHIIASAGKGAAIGNGTTSINSGTESGKVSIKDATVVTYSVSGSGIGSGNGSTTKPTINICHTADITFLGRAQLNIPAGISCKGMNEGDGFYVNLYYTITLGQGVDNKRIAIFDAETMALLRIIDVPPFIYRFEQIAFTTGITESKSYRVFLDDGNGFTELIRKDKKDHPDLEVSIHGINHDQGYTEYMFGINGGVQKGDFLHVVKGNGENFGLNWIVTEKYVDVDGNAIKNNAGNEEETILWPIDTAYTKTIPDVDGYTIIGYELDNFTNNLSPPPTAHIPSVTKDRIVYFVYEAKPVVIDVTVSKTVTDKYFNQDKVFTFTITFKDSTGSPLLLGTTFDYEGGVIDGSGAAKPADGTLTLIGGKDTFYLKHGQTITIKEIPPEYDIEIEEIINSEYYNVSFKDSEYAGITFGKTAMLNPVKPADGGERRIDFFNERKAIVPTGIADDTQAIKTLMMLSGLLLITSACISIIAKKRKRSW